jgi:hypothetical protein
MGPRRGSKSKSKFWTDTKSQILMAGVEVVSFDFILFYYMNLLKQM